ncbi:MULTISPECIES: hypothetical protein [unclassified Nocardiopsis]|uniref:hypothetical protein n=1 Tax=unclassified Nocardiopsis TaxID=2649073 RepID=UPI00135B40C5|nr:MULTISPECIES: hypothetical protein [unclassified Nocardiopsis]
MRRCGGEEALVAGVYDTYMAARAGMRTVYLNRTGTPLGPGRVADAEITSLSALLDLLPR